MSRTSSTSGHEKLFELVRPIAEYLYGYSLIAAIVIVNALTLNLHLKREDATNSTLLICPRGHGKTTLLYHILRKSNPKWFPNLPRKPFESQLLKRTDEDFRRKVWAFDDLIPVFRGTSTKQREQLMGFFTDFLTTGEYSREGRTVRGRIVCLFGIASEAVKKHAKRMFEATFSDRFMPVRYDFDDRSERELLNAKRVAQGISLPTVELPFKEGLVVVEVPARFEPEIDERALELNRVNVMTPARAQTYIQNFLKSSADLNGRNEVSEDDMRLLRLVWPFHFGVNIGRVEMRVRMMIFEASMDGRRLTGREIKDAIVAVGFSESSATKVLASLRKGEVVQCRRVLGGGRGFKTEYGM